MKVGILGAGNIASSHAAALRSSGIEISSVVDNSLEAAQKFAEVWDIPNYSSDINILTASEITCVHICAPPGLHYEMVKYLLENKKNILCEKPLCFSPDEALELKQLAEQQNVLAAIDLNVRFHPACLKAKEIISSSDFGPIMLTHGRYLQEFEILPNLKTWRMNETLAGKTRTITEIGTHWLDLIQFLTNSTITRVSASFNNNYPTRYVKDGWMYDQKPVSYDSIMNVASEDSAMIVYELDNHTFGSVVLSEISAGRQNHLEFEVNGYNKSVWWNSENPYHLYSSSKNQGVNSQIFAFGSNGFNDSIRLLIDTFYKTLTVKDSIYKDYLPSFHDGVRLSALCSAVYASSQSDGQWTAINPKYYEGDI